ncbi:hypothetical protein IL306_012676 [Fusarium sp. DS 682]|nr:hypothetical protein IL306_012676 [Fusarium sp. DS 682]
MSSNLLPKLKEFLKPFLGSSTAAQGEPRARFGHIQMPPYRLGEASLMELIRQEFMEGGCTDMNIFVVPDSERSTRFGTPDDNVETATLTFSALLEALRATKQAGDSGHEGSDWGVRLFEEEVGGWRFHSILPTSLVLVLHLDPQMSADCALSLIGVVQWALHVSTAISFSEIRVLTLSPDEDTNFLSKIVPLTAPGMEVAYINLAAYGEQDPAGGSRVSPSHDTARCAGEILSGFRSNQNRRRLIVSFTPELSKLLNKGLSEIERRQFKILPGDLGPKIFDFIPPSGNVVLQFSRPPSFLPLQFEGFDELHGLLSPGPHMAQAWDNISRQVIEYSRPISREDRRLQYWWIRQPLISERRLYYGDQALPLFLDGGGSRPLLVENSQLGGFVAAVFDTETWGVDVDGVLSHFVQSLLQVQEMKTRLRIQRLISTTGVALSKDEASIFRTILSTFKYDYRLAMLVALDSTAFVRRIKVQLAFMIQFGVNVISVKNESTLSNSKLRQDLLEGCLGIPSSLAKQGAMWLNLGLFKQYLLDPDLHKDALKISIRKEAFSKGVEDMLALLSQQGISVSQGPLSLAADADLSSDEERQLQQQLLRAYLYQLTVTYYPKVNGRIETGRGLSHTALSSLTSCEVRPSNILTLVSLKALLRKEGDFAFGICHGLSRPGGSNNLSCKDWTLIPGEIIAEWQSHMGRDDNIFEVLYTEVQHYTKN